MRTQRVCAEHSTCGYGKEGQSAKRFDQRISCGNRFLAVSAFRAECQPGKDGNIVIPSDWRFAFRTKATFRIGDAYVVRHTPYHYIQERSEDTADDQRGHQQYHHGRNIIHYIHAVHHFLDVTVESTTAEK